MNRGKSLLIVFLIFVVIGGGLYGLLYYLSLRTLVVNYQNIESVSVFSTNKLNDGEASEPIATITSPGQELTLRKGQYTLQYDAKENYQDLFVEIDLNEERQTVNLKPSYADEYLDGLLVKEEPAIKNALLAGHPKIAGLYDIREGKLFQDGSWYGTVLIYKGNDPFNKDSLRVVLKKENGSWTVESDPPYINLSKYDYPHIPIGVLRDVNSLPVPSLEE